MEGLGEWMAQKQTSPLLLLLGRHVPTTGERSKD